MLRRVFLFLTNGEGTLAITRFGTHKVYSAWFGSQLQNDFSLEYNTKSIENARLCNALWLARNYLGKHIVNAVCLKDYYSTFDFGNNQKVMTPIQRSIIRVSKIDLSWTSFVFQSLRLLEKLRCTFGTWSVLITTLKELIKTIKELIKTIRKQT